MRVAHLLILALQYLLADREAVRGDLWRWGGYCDCMRVRISSVAWQMA